MSRLSQLTKQLNEKANEQAKATETSLNSVFQEFETNLQAELKQSQHSMLHAIKQSQAESKAQMNKLMAYKTLAGVAMGILLSILIALGAFSLYLGKKIATQQGQLDDIQQAIDNSPLQAKALTKVQVTEQDGKIYIVSKTSKAKTWQNKDKQQIMELP